MPPWFWRLLLRLLVRGDDAEFVLGDVEEDYRAILSSRGPRAATRWYRRQVWGTVWAWLGREVRRTNAVGNRTSSETRGREGTMETTLRDIRYAIRGLLKRPGFTVLVVATLTLGIAASTAIFSVVHAVILQALPYPDAHRLVDVAEMVGTDRSSRIPTSAATFRSWREGTTSFDRMALSAPFQTLTLTGEAQALRLRADFVSSAYFDLLGAHFVLGHGVLPEDDTSPGDHPVAVLSHGMWQRVFGADPHILGRSITLNGLPYTVVGVLDKSFLDMRSGPTPTDVFVPASMIVQLLGQQAWERHTARTFTVIARLAPGRTLEQAQSEIGSVMRRLQKKDPATLGKAGVMLTPLRDQLLGPLDGPLLALLTGAVFLLLVGCINVASLMLVRGAARAREMAVRLALGAKRSRLVRQLTTEALVLALAGGAGGVLLASATLGPLLALSGNNLPDWIHVRLDPTVLGVAVLLALATGLAFGLVPALRSTRSDLRTELTRADARSGGGPGHRTRDALVVVEVMSAMILLVGSGLMIRSFQELARTDMGFRTERVLAASVNLPNLGYRSSDDIRAFDDQLLATLRSKPGVEFADIWGPGLPGQSGRYAAVVPEGRVVRSQLDADLTRVHNVSPGALEDMGLSVTNGRALTEEDRPESPPVAVISEGLAKKLFADEDPLGKRINSYLPPGTDPSAIPSWEVVGVVTNAKMGGRQLPAAFAGGQDMYFSVYQVGQLDTRRTAVLVGTTGDPLAMIPTVRSAVTNIDPDVPVFRPRSMEDVVGQGLIVARFVAVLLGIFGALSLLLAALGIYGVLSQTVVARSREVGLRMALGAQPASTLRLFVGHGLRLTLLGVGAGLLASLGLTRFLASQLYGVAPNDPMTLSVTAGLLVTVAVVAAYLPTRRALRVDPVIALKTE